MVWKPVFFCNLSFIYIIAFFFTMKRYQNFNLQYVKFSNKFIFYVNLKTKKIHV